MNTASLDLVEFVETQILPQYAAFDKAHNMEHVTRVIRRSLDLARQTGADLDMAYVIAAYHDLGLSGPRAIHHLTSGKILMADARLKRWFSKEQLQLMKEAVEDHRASASRSPRSIYGKIVAEADRDLSPETEKYSSNGYIRLWLHGSENERQLTELRTLIAAPVRMRPVFDKIFAEETTNIDH